MTSRAIMHDPAVFPESDSGTVLSRTLALPRRTCLPDYGVLLRSTTVPWVSLRNEHVVDDGWNTSRVRHHTNRG